MYGHTPLGEASKILLLNYLNRSPATIVCLQNSLKGTEASVQSAWEESLNEIWGNNSLKTKRDIEILLQFGENLGKHDRQTQQKQIMLTLTHLEREEEGARDQAKKI